MTIPPSTAQNVGGIDLDYLGEIILGGAPASSDFGRELAGLVSKFKKAFDTKSTSGDLSPKMLSDQLEKIRKLAEELAAEAAQLPGFVADLVQVHFSASSRRLSSSPPLSCPCPESLSLWAAALGEFRACCMDEKKLATGQKSLRRSGDSSVHERIMGDWFHIHSFDLAEMIGKYQGAEAVNSKPNGPLTGALEEIFKLISGLDDVTDHRLRKYARPASRAFDLQTKCTAVEHELKGLIVELGEAVSLANRIAVDACRHKIGEANDKLDLLKGRFRSAYWGLDD